MESKDHLEQLVKRYLNNQASEEELKVFFYLLRTGVLDEILSRQISVNSQPEYIFKLRFSLLRLRNVAAVVSLILLFGLLVHYYQVSFLRMLYPNNMTQVSTGSRELKSFKLPDSSVVTLNSNSAVQFSIDWSSSKREVMLTRGEAYFEVKKTEDHKEFSVKTADGMEINVLGTEFNVSCRGLETNVYLEEGQILLQTPEEKTMISPGELATFLPKPGRIRIQKVDGSSRVAWKNNIFFFEDELLSNVAQVLEEYYGIQIILPEKNLDHLRFTGKISRDKLNTVLDVIGETLNLKIIRNGLTVEFRI